MDALGSGGAGSGVGAMDALGSGSAGSGAHTGAVGLLTVLGPQRACRRRVDAKKRSIRDAPAGTGESGSYV